MLCSLNAAATAAAAAAAADDDDETASYPRRLKTCHPPQQGPVDTQQHLSTQTSC